MLENMQPCPFCEKADGLEVWCPKYQSLVRVECFCGACGPLRAEEADAVCDWNRVANAVWQYEDLCK